MLTALAAAAGGRLCRVVDRCCPCRGARVRAWRSVRRGSGVLGHSAPVITKLLYVDGTERVQRAAADRLGSLFENLDE